MGSYDDAVDDFTDAIKLKGDIEIIKVDQYDIKIISSKRLLEMKKAIKPLRDKDVFDIRALEKIINNIPHNAINPL